MLPTEAMVDASMRRSGPMRYGDQQPGRLQEGGAGDDSCGHGALGITTLRREVNKLAFYFRAVLLQPCQEFSRCFVRVLVDGMNVVASYVVS